MSEVQDSSREKPGFSDEFEAAAENRLFGNSSTIKTDDGEVVVVSDSNTADLYRQNPRYLRVPVGILNDKLTPEQVNIAREKQGSISGLAFGLFGYDKFKKLVQEYGVKPNVVLVPVNQNGEIPYLQVFFTEEGTRVDLDESDPVEFVPGDEWAEIFEKPRLDDNTLVFNFRKPNPQPNDLIPTFSLEEKE